MHRAVGLIPKVIGSGCRVSGRHAAAPAAVLSLADLSDGAVGGLQHQLAQGVVQSRAGPSTPSPEVPSGGSEEEMPPASATSSSPAARSPCWMPTS